MKIFNAIKQYISEFYTPEEYINLDYQIAEFANRNELRGRKVLDATPVFRNTLVKYLPLLQAGMELTVGYGNGIPYDEKIVDFLNSIGIATQQNGEQKTSEKFDFILDCAGANSNVSANVGYVELTRSGYYKYCEGKRKVFLADDSLIKLLETALGTGEGFLRGLKYFGYNDLNNKKVVVFGFGKVGQGVAYYALKSGAQVIVVDNLAKVVIPDAMQKIDLNDKEKIDKILDVADIVVSVTGIAGALAKTIDVKRLVKSNAIVANMGIHNEFGEDMPSERVLNNNEPLNFVLDEPTHLKYIAPTMALSNYGMLELLVHESDNERLIMPNEKRNREILAVLREKGCLLEELEFMEKYLKISF